jgi:hypothetical protein
VPPTTTSAATSKSTERFIKGLLGVRLEFGREPYIGSCASEITKLKMHT